MPFVQDNKNGNAPLGSIKDRIKNFEFMRESGATSPRARSPIAALNGENPRTIRRTSNLERDGTGTERRQIRRSERREAELRRENELMAKKENQQKEVDTSDEKSNRPTRKTVPRVTERRPLRVPPRVKEKPTEPALRRRIQDYRGEPRVNVAKIQEPVDERSSCLPGDLASPRTTESSSNETIDLNTSDDPADMSSEDTVEKQGQGKVEEPEKGEEEDAKTEEEQGESESNEEEEEEQEEEYGEEEDKEEEEEEDEEELEEEEEGEEEEEEEEEEEREDRGKGKQEVGQKEEEPEMESEEEEEEEEEEVQSVQKNEDINHNDRKGTPRTSTSTVSERKQVQKQSCGQSTNHKNVRKKSKSRRQQNNDVNNEVTTRQTNRERNDTAIASPTETKTKSTRRAARRTLSKNSMKVQRDSESPDEISKQHGGKSAEGKMKQTTKSEGSDTGSGSTSVQNKSKKNQVEEETVAAQAVNETENVPSPTQLNFYRSNVLGMVPVNMQQQAEKEEELVSSPADIKHEDIPTKKAFVCAIHEESCKYYCQDCERLICSECAMRWGDCHEHYYLRVKDAWKKYREEMMKILQDARSNVSRIQEDILENSKYRDSFKLKVDSTIKKINSFFDEHVQALEKRRTSFLETVEEIMKFREIGINQEIDSLQNNLVETSGTINTAGRVYGTSTMMEFLQVCKQLTNHLLELGQRKSKAHSTENVDIDFISEPSLFEEIEKLGQLRKHKLSSSTSLDQSEEIFGGETANEKRGEADQRESKPEEFSERRMSVESNIKPEKERKVEQTAHDFIDISTGETSTENLSESTSAKDINNKPRIGTELMNNTDYREPALRFSDQELKRNESGGKMSSEMMVNDMASQFLHRENYENEGRRTLKWRAEQDHQKETLEENMVGEKRSESTAKVGVDNKSNDPTPSIPGEDFNGLKEVETCSCKNGHPEHELMDYSNGFASDSFMDEKLERKQRLAGHQYLRRHSMDDTLGTRSKKEEIHRRLGNMGKMRSQRTAAQFLDEGERYFSSGEAEQRRRKQEYYKVRFNDRAYYSNPSDSSELEEMRHYDLEEKNRPMKQKVRRHRTLPLIRPISERQRDKCPWTLDVFRFHGKIHFSRNSLKATGKAFGWNAVIGSHGFAQGKHSWKVRVTKWTAVGICYKDDHIDNPSWGAGNKWTWDSADMCYSPRLGVCESPVGEWIDGDIIALELDCDNSVLIVHNLRTSETDKLFGFKEPVYPYFYLSVFRSISITEIDGVQVG